MPAGIGGGGGGGGGSSASLPLGAVNMSVTHAIKQSFGNGGASTISGTTSRSVAVEANVDDVINTGTYNQPYSWAVTPVYLQDLYIYCSANATLSINGTNDVQTITAPGSSTFTITFGGQTTTALDHATTTAAQMQAALALLSSVPSTLLYGVSTPNIQVSGPTGGPWVCTFVGQLGLAPQSPMTLSAGSIAHTTTGVVPTLTWSMVAGEAESWKTSSALATNPLGATVATTLSVTNTSGGGATVKVRAGRSQ